MKPQKIIIVTICILVLSVETSFGQTVYCDEAFECANETLTASFGSFYGRGYKSCYGSKTSISGFLAINPWGDRACQYANTLYTDDNIIYCDAPFSCGNVNANGITADDQVQCSSVLSCYDSYINARDLMLIECFGERSCENIEINDILYIYGYGTLSLKNSKITGNGNLNSQMYVYLHGYLAGYNSTIYCKESLTTCYIECQGNACYNTYFECKSTNCQIICDESQSIDCPINITSNLTNVTNNDVYNNNNNNNMQISRQFRYSALIDVFEISNTMDNDCSVNLNDSSFSLDHDYGTGLNKFNSTMMNSNENGNICCRGELACFEKTIIMNNGGSGNVLCSARKGCMSVNSMTLNGSNLYCHGYQSCYQAGIIENGNIIHCAASRACFGTKVLNSNTVICSGHDASCFKVNMYNISNVYFVNENSYFSLKYITNVTSNGVAEMNVYFMAYKSGQFIRIYCNTPGDICNIYCLTNMACMENSTFIICSNNTQCNIYCDVNNGIDCGNYIGNDSEYNIVNISSIYYSEITKAPTSLPTTFPTQFPSEYPSSNPSNHPTLYPSNMPTNIPTLMPNTTFIIKNEDDDTNENLILGFKSTTFYIACGVGLASIFIPILFCYIGYRIVEKDQINLKNPKHKGSLSYQDGNKSKQNLAVVTQVKKKNVEMSNLTPMDGNVNGKLQENYDHALAVGIQRSQTESPYATDDDQSSQQGETDHENENNVNDDQNGEADGNIGNQNGEADGNIGNQNDIDDDDEDDQRGEELYNNNENNSNHATTMDGNTTGTSPDYHF